MSENAADRDGASIIVTKLIMVFLGMFLVIFVITGVGYLGNAYYTARREALQLELAKQEAFTIGKSVGDFLRAELESERISQYEYNVLMAGADLEDDLEPPEEMDAATPLVVPPDKILPPPDTRISPADIAAMEGKAALIHTSMGTITVELYPELAPRTCKNFFYLVENGFYDGLYFHRSLPYNYIQAGSPTGMRGGSAGYWLNMEFNNVSPVPGTLVALSSQEAPQVSSEFMILLTDGSDHEGTITVFGRVIDGFNIAERIGDTRWDHRGYSWERTYIRKIEIVDAASVRPEEDFWATYGR